ncbi:hypothetical protein [uncultured virus]|uniref:Uncharacterized protein n=1 Tax=uncultured virus TaxID=340016 RepID=A0A5Q0TWX0_9VIRU|nr:hypothetical protein [uncultured virus]
MRYKTLEEIKVKVEEVFTVEQFINLTEEEKETYYKLYRKAFNFYNDNYLHNTKGGHAFMVVERIHYIPFKHYVIADYDYNDFNECYTQAIYKIDGKYLYTTYNNIEVVRKEDFKHLLYNHAQRWGNLSFSFSYPITSKIRIIKHLYPNWKKIVKWLQVAYEDKLVQKSFTIYEFIDFLEGIEKMFEEWKQGWLERLSKARGKPAKITIIV